MNSSDRNRVRPALRLVGKSVPFKAESATACPSVDSLLGSKATVPGLTELQDTASTRQMEMLDAMNGAAVMLVAAGRVYCCNRAGLRLMGDGIALRDHKLVATDRRSDVRLQHLVCKAMTDQCDPSPQELSTVVLMRRNRRPLLATLLLVHREQDLPQGGYAILLITDPDDRSRPDEAILRAAFGLTPSEVRLAESLTVGPDSAADAAESETSRKMKLSQLRAIYRKTKTNRRRELVQLLISLRPPTRNQAASRAK